MSNTKVSTALNKITASIYNPNLMQDAISDFFTDTVNGVDYEILDPNNPVILAIEAAALMSYASVEDHAKACRNIYASMSIDWGELYGHMSEEDFKSLWGQPSALTLVLMLDKNEIINRAYPASSTGTRRLVIPGDSFFTVAGVSFAIQYPIEFRLLPSGELQVVYDTTTESPIKELTTNSLDWEYVSIPVDGKSYEMVAIRIPTLQYQITSYNDTIMDGTNWVDSFSFSDSYYTTRVWYKVDGAWVEIPTTASTDVLDTTVLTAVVTPSDSGVQVEIPTVYINKGMISGAIRVDVYSTKGDLSMSLASYAAADYGLSIRDLNNTISSSLTSPMSRLSTRQIYSDDTTSGGRNALTFAEAKARVISNGFGSRQVPISPNQLSSQLKDLGYELSTPIDTLTERTFLITNDIPEPTYDGLSTPIGTVNGILETTLGALDALTSIKDNGGRITILPSTLYKYDNGMVYFDTSSLDAYKALRPSEQVSYFNSGRFMYSPFHYVLDLNDDVPRVTPYYLDSPKVSNKQYVGSNNSLGLTVATDSYVLTKTDAGYTLRVVTRSGETYKTFQPEQLKAQLSFTPRGYSEVYAWVYGTFVGFNADDEAIFDFEIDSNLDINRNDDIIVTNFTMIGDGPTDNPLQLDGTFNLIYSIVDYTPADYLASDIDDILVAGTEGEKAITLEKLTVDLGTPLTKLWANVRPISSSLNYATHEEDVYDIWEEDVWVMNPNNSRVRAIVFDENKRPKFIRRHKKGDYRLDGDGDKIVKYKKGSVVYGNDGKPVIDNPRKLAYRLELFLLDARFAIADDTDSATYRDNAISFLLDSVVTDMNALPSLLEESAIYYYPRNTVGNIAVTYGNGTTDSISAETQFAIKFYLSKEDRNNSKFLTTLNNNARSTLVEAISGTYLSATKITAALEDISDNIIALELADLGPNKDQKVIVINDTNDRPVIGKKVKLNADQTISVVDDILISYATLKA